MTSIDLGSQSAAWDASDVDWSAPPTAMSPSGEASSSGRLSGGASINDRPSLSIVLLDSWLRALTPSMLEHRWVRTFLGLPLLPSVNASSLYIYHSSPGRSI